MSLFFSLQLGVTRWLEPFYDMNAMGMEWNGVHYGMA